MKKKIAREDIAGMVTVLQTAIPLLEGIEEVVVGGSWRRGKKELGDLDMSIRVAEGKPLYKARDALLRSFRIVDGVTKGEKYFDGAIGGVWCNFWLYRGLEHRGGMSLFNTGSGKFNTSLRGRAKERGLLLNRYGLWTRTAEGKRGEFLYGETEEGIFRMLDLEYIPPAQRGEFALKGKGSTPRKEQGKGSVADTLQEIARYYASEGETWRANAFAKAARIARQYRPEEWGSLMGERTLDEARYILETGQSRRI